jgi:hypothetical protein
MNRKPTAPIAMKEQMNATMPMMTPAMLMFMPEA